ncbi:MAG: metal-dependent transcriptional regulator [Bacilli bacterium]|jgi:DtxR family Mn-dependent transcriptional regulator|nr:metal-dependent transcriptional regulator [Bacilli bacterium]MCH4202282.1 metal-dependent transcriptional regulator [Bacilli bacterium]
MNRATENYLKSIYELSLHHDNEFVKLSSLAKSLGFTSQSVNEMIKRLVEQNLVVFIPYQGVKLSDDGKKIAIELIRSHRIWEAFLLKELNFSDEELIEQADALEHASSKSMLDKLYFYLGQPKYCHHGHPIPRPDGTIPPITHYSLWEEEVGSRQIIAKNPDIENAKRKLLPELSKVTIVAHNHDGVKIQLADGAIINLTQAEAKKIFVLSSNMHS